MKGKWEVCDKETQEWQTVLAAFNEALMVLDQKIEEHKNGNGRTEPGRG